MSLHPEPIGAIPAETVRVARAAFPVWLHVYVRDVDETYQRALDYGAGSVQTPSEQGDGDRRGGIRDPAGNTWWIATHLGR